MRPDITAAKRAGLKPIFLLWLFILVAVALAGAGCAGGLLPQKRTESAAVKTSDSVATQQSLSVEKITEGEQAPVAAQTITISGVSNHVTIAEPPAPAAMEVLPAPARSTYRQSVKVESGADTAARSQEQARSSLAISLPLGISIALFAGALLLLLFAVKKLRASSRSVDAMFTAGDTALANLIHRKESELKLASDAAAQARLATELAELEKQRGKLNAE